jgi:3D (Asp-Asp-Asp) domain-containing protein
MTDRTQVAFATAIATAAVALACSSVAPTLPPEAPRPHPPSRTPEPTPVEPEPAVAPTEPEETQLRVTATAYNSLPSQGVGRGMHGAWGDRLEPGMKTIAVSHDLIALGLTRGAVVRIEGLPGEYTVLDRLPSRWSRRIDVYMGKDRRAARAWGRREVQIRWQPSAAANAD